MNRPLKFRVWDHILSEWIKSDQLVLRPNGSITDGSILIDSKYIQFNTSLNDKNGKEIYEGDIVKWGDLNYIVEYNHTACKWQGRSPEHHGYLHLVTEHFRDLMNGIIISNIFEHKHLLEK